jgi:UMP-CMP kinase
MFSAILRRNTARVSAFKKPLTQRLYSSAAPKSSGSPSVPAMLAVASMGLTAYYTFATSKNGNGNINIWKKKQYNINIYIY